VFAVGGEGRGVDRARVALERLQCSSCRGVPEPDRLVGRARHDLLAVGREDHGVDRARMALECLKHRTPMCFYSRFSLNPRRNTSLERFSNNALL
jgi:hypothetical protein